jgi:hypothetical protein
MLTYQISTPELLHDHGEKNLINVYQQVGLIFLFLPLQVAGITANTEQNIAPLVPISGRSPLLQLSNEPHMSIVASENAG